MKEFWILELVRDRRRIVRACLAAVILAGLGALAVWQTAVFRKVDGSAVFCEGIRIGNIPVGGKTWDQALAILEENDRLRGETLLFALDNNGAEWFIDGGEVGRFDTLEMLADAWEIGRRGPAWLRWLERTEARLLGWHFTVSYTLDAGLLEIRLEEISKELYAEPIDAELAGFDTSAAEGSRIAVREEVSGYGLDIGAMTAACIQTYEQKGWGNTVPVALRALPAELTAEDIRDMDPPIVAYGYRPGEYHLLRESLAAESVAIGAVILRPGDSFSLQRALETAGFPPMERRLHLPSAVYGAALQAGLSVIEHHRGPAGELPVAPGLEAETGSAGDLVLRNDTGRAMVLWVRAGENQLTVEVYRLPYGNCAYVRLIGVQEGEGEPRVFRILCDEDGREVGREEVG